MSCRVYRSGKEAVHDGQRAAAKALGLSQWQTLRHAIVPQGVRNALPALLNLIVALQKDVALLSVIGVREAVREAGIYTSRTFNYSSYLVAAGLFLLASVPLARLPIHNHHDLPSTTHPEIHRGFRDVHTLGARPAMQPVPVRPGGPYALSWGT
jgi:ABC-type amino acid transport system permease subunit